jgi:adenine-specific DNA-methyltransferase
MRPRRCGTGRASCGAVLRMPNADCSRGFANHGLGVKFRRQHPIGPYMVDFFCREAGLVVEVDPGPVRRDGVVRPDAERENYLKQHGLRVLRLSREDVMTGFDSVLEQITDLSQPP